MRNPQTALRKTLLAMWVAAVVWQSAPVWAQTTAMLQGTVKDESGSVMPAVRIEIRNERTGAIRSATTDSRGEYRVLELTAGFYSVEAKQEGFQTQRQSGIELFVGGRAVVDLRMALGAVTSVVEVMAAPNIVETTSATLSNVVNARQVEDLPLNARSFDQLALLNPGVVLARTSGTNAFNGQGAKVSIGGARPEGASYLFDGADVNTATNVNAGSAAGFQMGVEAIQEFRVLRHAFPAEYGRASGGIINVISKSGTNSFHGSLFEFLRNNKLDAKNFFDKPDPTPIPPFRRNQFGGSLGGPIVRDRTFFFTTYEGLRERLGVTLVSAVPDLNMRKGYLPNPSTGALELIGVHPAVQPYMDLYPLPNGRIPGNGTAELISSPQQKLGENYGLLKLDHRFSDKDSFFLSWVSDRAEGTRPTNALFATLDTSRKNFATISETHIFSPALLNTARFSFSRSEIAADNAEIVPIPDELNFVPASGAFGNLGVPNLSGIGPISTLPVVQVTNLFEVDDMISLNRGSHTFKFGGRIKRYQFNQAEPFSFQGSWTFGSQADFMQNRPRTVTVGALDSDHVRGYRQFLNGFFVQDDWRVHARLTLNLGVRYEFITNPSEVNGKISNFADPRDKELRITKVIFNQNPSTKNFMPRVGFAWDLFGTGKTAIRAGFGTFYEQILPRTYRLLNLTPPFFKLAVGLNPTFFPRIDFNQLTLQQPNQLTVRGIDPNMQTPYAIQYNLDIQQQLGGTLLVSVGYAGTRGVKLFQRSDFNLRKETILPGGRRFWPVGAPLQNPNFGVIEWRTTQVSSFYNAFELSVEKRVSHGLRFQAAYTYSRSVDDGAGELGSENVGERSSSPIFWDLQHLNRGLSTFDLRHSLVFNYNYAFPIAAGRDFKSQIFGGWEWNGINTLQTGQPLTVLLDFDRARAGLGSASRVSDRPDLKNGFRNNPVTGITAGCAGVPGGQKLGRPDLYLDPCAFQLAEEGFLGNLGRNTVIGPGLAVFDFSLQKRFVMPGEGKQLLFRAEFYNLFNRPNFHLPALQDKGAATGGGANLFSNASGIPNLNAARIFFTSTSSRQIQFALKYVF